MIGEFIKGNESTVSKKLKFSMSKTGEARWYYTTLSRTSTGEIACVSVDIHEQESKDQMLKEQQEKLVHAKQLGEVGNSWVVSRMKSIIH